MEVREVCVIPAHPAMTLLGIGGALPQAALPHHTIQTPSQDSRSSCTGMRSGKWNCVRKMRAGHRQRVVNERIMHSCGVYDVCCFSPGGCSHAALLLSNQDGVLTPEDDLVGAVKGSGGLSCKKCKFVMRERRTSIRKEHWPEQLYYCQRFTLHFIPHCHS